MKKVALLKFAAGRTSAAIGKKLFWSPVYVIWMFSKAEMNQTGTVLPRLSWNYFIPERCILPPRISSALPDVLICDICPLCLQDTAQPSDMDSGVSNPLSQPPAESGVPLPALNLLFKDGQLKEWSGRAPPPLDISALQKDQPT